MPQGKATSEAVQWIVIRLSVKLTVLEIAMYTNIGERRVWDILAHFEKTGGVNVPKREKVANSRSLHDEEIQVSDMFWISHSDLIVLLASIQDTQ